MVKTICYQDAYAIPHWPVSITGRGLEMRLLDGDGLVSGPVFRTYSQKAKVLGGTLTLGDAVMVDITDLFQVGEDKVIVCCKKRKGIDAPPGRPGSTPGDPFTQIIQVDLKSLTETVLCGGGTETGEDILASTAYMACAEWPSLYLPRVDKAEDGSVYFLDIIGGERVVRRIDPVTSRVSTVVSETDFSLLAGVVDLACSHGSYLYLAIQPPFGSPSMTGKVYRAPLTDPTNLVLFAGALTYTGNEYDPGNSAGSPLNEGELATDVAMLDIGDVEVDSAGRVYVSDSHYYSESKLFSWVFRVLADGTIERMTGYFVKASEWAGADYSLSKWTWHFYGTVFTRIVLDEDAGRMYSSSEASYRRTAGTSSYTDVSGTFLVGADGAHTLIGLDLPREWCRFCLVSLTETAISISAPVDDMSEIQCFLVPGGDGKLYYQEGDREGGPLTAQVEVATGDWGALFLRDDGAMDALIGKTDGSTLHRYSFDSGQTWVDA